MLPLTRHTPACIDMVVAKSLSVFSHVLVRYWGCEINDCVIQGVHLDQESLKLLHRTSSYVGSQFDQCFVVSNVGKATHVDFERKLLKIVPPTVPAVVNQAMRVVFFKTDPTTMPIATMIKAKAFKQLWRHLKW